MARIDGRSNDECRPMHVAVDVLPNCAGSAAVEHAACRVMCVVRGPQQLQGENVGPKGKIKVVVERCPFAQQIRRDMRDAELEGEYSQALQGIVERGVLLDTIPQLLYEVNVLILSSDGSTEIAAIVTAVCAAIANAGIPSRDLYCCCTACVATDNSDILIDPSQQELQHSKAAVTVVAAVTSNDIYFVRQQGAIRSDIVISSLRAACEGCKLYKQALRSALCNSISK